VPQPKAEPTNDHPPIKKPVKGQGVGEIVSDPYGEDRDQRDD